MNEFDRWFNDKGDDKYRYNYPLNENSLVFDVGGYEGNFSEKIYKKYNCEIFIFEPIKKYYDELIEKYKNFKKIKIFNFGLSNINSSSRIYHSGDSSSIFKITENYEDILLKNFSDFLIENQINQIDLLKLNIEGSEFEVIENIIENKLLSKIINLQVQFHSFVTNSTERRNKIREFLKKTHVETFCYEFVWENWKKIN